MLQREGVVVRGGGGPGEGEGAVVRGGRARGGLRALVFPGELGELRALSQLPS